MESGLVLSGVLAALAGIVIAALISLIPGLHIYNVIAITMIFYFAAMETFTTLDPLTMTCFLLGMVVAFSMLFTVSSQYFQPSDESFRSIVLPHERFLLEGRAHEAVMLGGIGALVAMYTLVFVHPVATGLMTTLIRLIQPHHYWIVGTVIVFILMTEWPKDHGVGKTVFQRLQDGWVQLLMGYFTFFAAGILGIFVFYRTVVPLESAFQSLMPLFVGLFAIPSFVMAFVTETTVPEQHMASSVQVSNEDVFRGGLSGVLAGVFAAVNPGLTPGPALLMSGHITAQSGERQFIIGGGAGRLMYYVGAIFLFFLPGVYLRRGGAAINISLFFVPETLNEYYLLTGIIALTGGLSFLLLAPFSRLAARLVRVVPYQAFSAIGLVLLTGLVWWVTGVEGLMIMSVATVLGIVPNLWHTRRINLLAVLLVPIFLNMAGYGPAVARLFGIY